jgi:hypothetical protein
MASWKTMRRKARARFGEKARLQRLHDPEVEAKNTELLEERAAGKPLGPGVSAESLPDFLRDFG